jgi:hypothetical protein
VDREQESNGSYGYPRLPLVFRRWFDIVRVVVLFALGVGQIIYASVTPGHDVAFIVAGLVLCGLVPVDMWLSARRRETIEVAANEMLRAKESAE